jgi:hypothetical protein
MLSSLQGGTAPAFIVTEFAVRVPAAPYNNTNGESGVKSRRIEKILRPEGVVGHER